MLHQLNLRSHRFSPCAALVVATALTTSSAVAQEKATTSSAPNAAPTAAPATEAPATEASARSSDQPKSQLPRVFVAKLQAGSGASEGEASLLNDALLVAIKRFDAKFEIRTSQDIEDIVALEAAQAMSGCDVVSCAAEIGDALGADQLVTGQLGRVGKTWILSLTRTDRATLKAISRTQERAVGDAPDVLFPLMDKQTAEVFGQTPAGEGVVENTGPSTPLLIGGGAVLAVGAFVAVGSVVAFAISWAQFSAAGEADTPSKFDDAVGVSQAAYAVSVGLGIGAATLALVGAGGIGAAFVLGGE